MKNLPWTIAITGGPTLSLTACWITHILRGKNAPIAILTGLIVLLMGHIFLGSYLKDQQRPIRLTGLILLLLTGTSSVFLVPLAAT